MNVMLVSKCVFMSNYIQCCIGIYIVNMDVLYILFVLVLLIVVLVDFFMFYLVVNQKKCLKEEIYKDVLVIGEY